MKEEQEALQAALHVRQLQENVEHAAWMPVSEYLQRKLVQQLAEM